MNVAVRPQHLDILSICTGGAGLDLGIELAVPGARSVCMVEREAFAVAHLVSAMQQGLLHQAPVWSNVRTFDGRRWRGCVDGLIGGIPCQPHSLAGRKQGSLDERDLWQPTRRIIVQSGVWFVLIENVGGMLSAGADEVAGAERVWRDLLKLGFSVEIGLFTAAEVGASHERERVFILGVADSLCRFSDGGRPRSVSGARGSAEGEAQGQDRKWRRDDARDGGERLHSLADASNSGSQGHEFGGSSGERHGQEALGSASEFRGAPLVHSERTERGTSTGRRHQRHRDDPRRRKTSGGLGERIQRRGEQSFVASKRGPLFPPGPGSVDEWQSILQRAPELEPAVRRMADGLAGRVDPLRMLGNGVVPLQAAYAIRTLATRLAGRGSAGAARLVWMMEAER